MPWKDGQRGGYLPLYGGFDEKSRQIQYRNHPQNPAARNRDKSGYRSYRYEAEVRYRKADTRQLHHPHPGTLTLDISGETLYVHTIDIGDGDRERLAREIKEEFEKAIGEMTRKR